MGIRHIVLLAFKEGTTLEKISSIATALRECCQKISGVNFGHFCNYKSVSNNPKRFTHYFFIDFIDEHSRDAYLQNDEHIRIAKEMIIPALANGLESLLVFDHEKTLSHSTVFQQTSNSNKAYVFFQKKKNLDIEGIISNEFKSNCTIEPYSNDFDTCTTIKTNEQTSHLAIINHALIFQKSHARQEKTCEPSVRLPTHSK